MLPKNRITMHPGELLAEILTEHRLSQAQFASDIGVSEGCVSDVVAGRRPVTADLALRFGKAFGQSQQMWLNLQAMHDRSRAYVEATAARKKRT
jgi:antitoxin HigA-1